MVKIVNSLAEFESAISQNEIVIADFFADWCGPCKRIAPFYEESSKKYTKIVFIKVNVDEASEVTEKENITSMPTFKVYKNGVAVDTLMGANEAALKNLIEKYAS
ncbi:thioredoxin 1, putative [Plasmodium chabaudi chabaudi]|uniref:Thioredoxin n=2 Tax=Plasmodium chabaudi TaxID=5825 RepID=A0A077TNQ6_PLACU|nr:thioredoxin 1, putative [Plasmodium chabaudi chabaudi]SCM09877.1 thioredoxin 1, putative [Plasmodium chabaudi adami]SCM04457.1 thioredoxin 1, putative [Plasmodium chabaudi chabaudi]SCM07775.1 thioredoxin 1, putative [Plasmodium chabaudi chabaudi]SCM12215.1 thioredoxin 1, putative [Plasmodium chabaudi adami]VTZ70192.1 thioredoxin 1, putative [Plasmodium chabaudi chabaudi]|eukprot:XP_016654532.1 thioredoxin 1, putative [Plasmodium chabaudi chabaudi]